MEQSFKMNMLERIKEHAISIPPTFFGACRIGDLKAVKKYIEEGIDVTSEDDKAIILASKNGHLEVVRLLIKNGADCNYAILLASENGHVEIVRLLIENGADCNTWNNKVIRWASEDGHLEIVELLKKAWSKTLK
jgi:ankyrin repeat protein